jgi:hypothetical protein
MAALLIPVCREMGSPHKQSMTLRKLGELQNMQLAQFFSQLQQKQRRIIWNSTARDCRNAL